MRVGRVELRAGRIGKWLNHADSGSVEPKHRVAAVISDGLVSSAFIPSWATGGQQPVGEGVAADGASSASRTSRVVSVRLQSVGGTPDEAGKSPLSRSTLTTGIRRHTLCMVPMKRTALSAHEVRALTCIRNKLVHSGTAPSVRELAAELGYKSPRSAALIIDRLIECGFLARRDDRKLQLRRMPFGTNEHARTVPVPLVGTVAAGSPMLATENIETTIPVSDKLAKGNHRYFLLRVSGNSMNRAGIRNGDLALVRQQSTAEPGQNVVALIDDEATVKRLRITPEAIVLEPVSTDPTYRPIILDREFVIQGVVVGTIPAA